MQFTLRCERVETRPDAVLLWLYGTDSVFATFPTKPTEKQLRLARRFLIRAKALHNLAEEL